MSRLPISITKQIARHRGVIYRLKKKYLGNRVYFNMDNGVRVWESNGIVVSVGFDGESYRRLYVVLKNGMSCDCEERHVKRIEVMSPEELLTHISAEVRALAC